MSFLFPKQPMFFEYFKDLSVCLKEIAALFNNFSKDFKDADQYSRKAKEIEGKADNITHEIIRKLSETFITPFDREDIHLLANEMDDILDLIEDVIRNVYTYKVTEKSQYFEEFGGLIFKASEDLEKLIHKCFMGKKYAHKAEDLIIQIHNLEDEGDHVFKLALKDLFEKEKDPINLIKWKDIFENLEEIMDTFQRVCITTESIIIKSS
jgi:uncharacterized protein